MTHSPSEAVFTNPCCVFLFFDGRKVSRPEGIRKTAQHREAAWPCGWKEGVIGFAPAKKRITLMEAIASFLIAVAVPPPDSHPSEWL